ncbi:MAG: hypothetical protein HN457_15310 [Opitutales bacterium]|nr:hypothetical protein [Opitutales bacterium]
MFEHCEESVPGDVAFGFAVNLIAKSHVVGRNGLGDCPGCTACLEEYAGGFLTCTDLGEGSIFGVIQIDGERFAIGGKQFVLHGF